MNEEEELELLESMQKREDEIVRAMRPVIYAAMIIGMLAAMILWHIA